MESERERMVKESGKESGKGKRIRKQRAPRKRVLSLSGVDGVALSAKRERLGGTFGRRLVLNVV